MGHTVNSVEKTVNSVEKRVKKLEIRMAELEDEIDEVVEIQAKQKSSMGPDRRWVSFVDPEDFIPLSENGYVCETENCNNGTWIPDEIDEDDIEGSMAHWEYAGQWPIELPEGVCIPCYICSECMQAILEDRRPE